MRIVREADRDRYLSVLFAPADRRAALLALYAFNVEVARIRDVVREPMPGEIRLQWWRDAILSGEAAGHPVAVALNRAIKAHDLPLAAFDNYLEARIFDLYDDPMPSRNDLEGYCGETASALIHLAGLVLDREAALAAADMAGHAGCAQALTGLLRLLPIHLARGQCFVPRDLLAAAGMTPEAFVSGKGVRHGALEAMIALADEHLRMFWRRAGEMPSSLRPAFLPLAPVRAYLSGIKRQGMDAFARSAEISPLSRYGLMTLRAVRGWPKDVLR
jgi:phytoene synthase